MIIIGEKLNSSIPSALEAMKNSEDEIVRLIKLQSDAGADYLDINTALMTDAEYETMERIAKLVLSESECGIMLDSPSPDVLTRAAKLCGDRKLILNSVTSDERIDEIAPVAAELGCGIVVMPMSVDEGIPTSAEGRLACAMKAIEKLTAAGVSEENVYVDAICETLATGDTNALTALDTIKLVKEKTGAKTTCGLSNVSFGLPKRAFINAAFMSMAILCGLDSAIIDPTSKELRKALHSAEAVAGKDEYCMNYLEYVRGEFDI